MKSNFCEDKTMKKSGIIESHEKHLKSMKIPSWACVKCPFCHKQLPLSGIRSISWKLNPRNVGDVAVEFYCDDCSLMDTLYFRKEADSASIMAELLNNTIETKNVSVLEESMYKMQYNNAVEIMQNGDNKMPMIKRGTCSSIVTVSECAYCCKECGHTLIRSEVSKGIKCPKCSLEMTLIGEDTDDTNSDTD